MTTSDVYWLRKLENILVDAGIIHDSNPGVWNIYDVSTDNSGWKWVDDDDALPYWEKEV